ncbi:hypothetical protein [Listeria ilorinensis]|uniref:hypothetical protein n=1 Tax=Listeria ilorinensis TaxID=2867439 RepID=UPI001EF6D5B6|nr:hypothetical protein [Listeria ilorinensis]
MKKIVLALGIACVTTLGLTACGSEESSDSSSEKKEKKATDSTLVKQTINLEVDETLTHTDEEGNVVITGKTDPGATLTVNRDPQTVNEDGSFSITKFVDDSSSSQTFTVLATKLGYEDKEVTVSVTNKSKGHEEYLQNETKKQEDAKSQADQLLATAESTLNQDDLTAASDFISSSDYLVLSDYQSKIDEITEKINAKALEDAKKADQEKAKQNATDITFQMLDKNADTYAGEPYYLKGEVIQAMEDGGMTLFRVNITQSEYGYWTDTVAVIYFGATDAVQDDIIEVYGTVYGNYSYTSTLGAELTIPGIAAEEITVVN